MPIIGFEWNQADDIVNHLRLIQTKTLILHDGEYKKYQNAIDAIYELLTPIMTSNTSPSGVAFASSIYSSEYDAWYAFNQNNDNKEGYVSQAKVKGGYLGYIFTEKKRLRKYSLTQGSMNAFEAPKSWTIEGSNDTTNGSDGTWVIIDTQVNQTDVSLNGTREYMVDNNDYYKSYRINSTENQGTSTHLYVGIDEFKMYDEIFAIEAEFSTISTTLPTQEQFLTEGMDSLSPLLDRRVETLEPLKMESKSEILQEGEVGKVFSKKISLKKYIDLRQIKVEVK